MNKTLLMLLPAALLASCSLPKLKIERLPDGCYSWPALPLRVFVEEPGDEGEVLAAVDDWNKVSKTPLFVVVHASPADVTVSEGLWRSTNDAETVLSCAGGHVVADVSLNSVTEPGQRLEAFEHELGHALGLGHYESDTSVMSANLDPSLLSGPDSTDFDTESIAIARPRKPRGSEAAVAVSLRR